MGEGLGGEGLSDTCEEWFKKSRYEFKKKAIDVNNGKIVRELEKVKHCICLASHSISKVRV
jgi:hypothetical protein